MIFRSIKIVTVLASFFFLTGFLPFVSLLGPSLTVVTSGNVYKAGTQYLFSKTMNTGPGKNSLNLIIEKIDNKEKVKEDNINQQLKNLVEKRIKITKAKLNFQNINQ